MAAIGLELTRVSDGRLRTYETILEEYSRDPVVDRAYFFFAREIALERVKELQRRSRQDGFFVFHHFSDERRRKIVL